MNITNMTKLLEKIFRAGFKTEKDILAMQLEDLQKLPDLSGNDIKSIINLKKAIKNRELIAFLSATPETKKTGGNNG